MELLKLIDLSHNEYRKIRNRQLRGNMKIYYDNLGYICYDRYEYENYKPQKKGRKPKGV